MTKGCFTGDWTLVSKATRLTEKGIVNRFGRSGAATYQADLAIENPTH